MMITNILETLSDGELIVIGEQMYNPQVNEELLYQQIVKKGNENETLNEMYDEMNSDRFRGTLPRLVAVELASRFRKALFELKPDFVKK